MSAYRAWPDRSETMVFTQGMPWYLFRTASTWPVVSARLMPNQVFMALARLPALASRSVNADVLVHGTGVPSRLLITGPYRVDHSVRVTRASEPSGRRATTVTARWVIATGRPFSRYSVGCPLTRLSW